MTAYNKNPYSQYHDSAVRGLNHPGTSMSLNASKSVPQSHSSNHRNAANINSSQHNKHYKAFNPNQFKMTLKLLQWNLNGYFNNLHELQLLMRELKPSDLALQETHLINISVPNTPKEYAQPASTTSTQLYTQSKSC